MATLQIKNKYEVSLRKLVKESKTDGGIPDVITVNGREGWDILNEIKLVGNTGFMIETTGQYDPNFLLKSNKEKIDKETATDLINRWWKEEFKVIFKDGKDRVPLKVVNEPRPKAVDKPEETDDNED